VRKPKYIVILVLLVGALLCCSPWALADGLVIHSGSTLNLNDATLDLNCMDLTIEDGGTLDLGSGRVRRLGALTVSSGGLLIWGTGRIHDCTAKPWIPLLLLLDDEASP
jgi:hypothetical protein